MNVIFTDPQLAFVALTENEARAGGACGSNGYLLHVDF
jgi:pyruvate/2-oxoglutarate dehydrogenase complex dihydrolipoamide dehydrogenase (E3) component